MKKRNRDFLFRFFYSRRSYGVEGRGPVDEQSTLDPFFSALVFCPRDWVRTFFLVRLAVGRRAMDSVMKDGRGCIDDWLYRCAL